MKFISNSRYRRTQYHLRRTGKRLRVGMVYGLMAIALAYTAIIMVVVAMIGIAATPLLSLLSMVLGAVEPSLPSKY
jgi:hypothetical protein